MKILVVATDELDQAMLCRRIDGYVHSDPPVDVFVIAGGGEADALLNETVTRVKLLGVSVAGEVAGADLAAAAASALSHFGAHRVLVPASPSRIAQWLHRDLPHRLQNRTKAIVETIAVPIGRHHGAGDGQPAS